MRNILTTFLVTAFSLYLSLSAYSQISIGGVPPGFKLLSERQNIQTIVLAAPDYKTLKKEDDSVSSLGYPERMGVILPVDYSIENSGSWTYIGNDTKIWRLKISVEGAVGLGLYFKDFELASGDKLFVYSSDKSHVIGAFTNKNNRKSKLFATEPVKGDSILIELVDNLSNPLNSYFTINEVLVVYTQMQFPQNGLDQGNNTKSGVQSDFCEVNINCPEGAGWEDEARGVVRIQVKNGDQAFWCTGSIMNNTALDFRPLLLTADHCARSEQNGYAPPEDVEQWIFHFGLVSIDCNDNTPIASRSMIGAVKLASNTLGQNGSDFYLMELSEQIPNSFEPYFQGWSALNGGSENGVAIHHPEGDVKKISTYLSPTEVSQWGETPETHFRVNWGQTDNGHGVTEGGSSGSPLFNNEGLIIGQLTGGESSCDYTEGPDYFGRIYYSWDRAGTSDTIMLKPWLDPINTGLLSIDGTYNTKVSIARFVATETTIPVNSFVTFSDLSTNAPQNWKWIFEAGNPSESSEKDPGRIYFNSLGAYNVTLVVTNEFGTDSLVLTDYIRVVPVVFPNPTRGTVSILFGLDEADHYVTISNSVGKKITEFAVSSSEAKVDFTFNGLASGMYIFSVKTGELEEHFKVLFAPL